VGFSAQTLLAREPLAAAGALGGGEHGVGEGRVEGSDAQVAGDDELAAQAALQRRRGG
jgi:hypothetical protein